jgi:eukaryotic-like serine/threonine-protein kinase
MKFTTATLKGFLLNLGVVLVLLAIAVLYFFFGFLPGKTNHGETITVPDLQGLSIDNVESYVTQRNLRYEVNDSTYSEDFPPLTILKQYPSAGSKVKEGRKIFISVNRVAPPSVPIPDLINQSSLRNAEAVLKSNELKRGRINYKPSPFLNLVLEMHYDGKPITPGLRVPKGSTIDLVVGNGYSRSNIPTPDLIGQDYGDASFIILGSSLKIGQVTVEGDTTNETTIVIRQQPESGQEIKLGDPVDLWIMPASDTVINRTQALLNE